MVVSSKANKFQYGAIHKRRQNILEGRGSQIPMLQDIRRWKLDISGTKFRHGAGGNKNGQKYSVVFYGWPLILIQNTTNSTVI